MSSYKAFHKLHPASLLARLSNNSISGCLQVSNQSISWLIYFDHGELIFATNSNKAFERLDRHLEQLSQQVPVLIAAVRVQVRLLFERSPGMRSTISADYRAVHWLVEQQYLTLKQATVLVESLASEVLESFLALTEGTYKLIEKEAFVKYPKLCQFDIHPFIKHLQVKPQQQPVAVEMIPPLSQKGSEFEQKNNRPPLDENSSPDLLHYEQRTKPLQSCRNCYKVVCIDDSQIILQTIKIFLNDASFMVIMINNPLKALMQVIRSKPDIILLDVEMPNLDGYELCSLLRKHAGFKHLPIIMVTGNTRFVDRARAKLAGASGYLTKPFTQPELLKVMFKYLS